MSRTAPWSAGMLAALVTALAGADDLERVRAFRAAGEIVPLSRILDMLHALEPTARVVEAELEREGGRWIYEIEFLDGERRLRERIFDARTGRPLE